MAERIKLSDFEEKVLNSSVPVLVDFYSDSCVPCKRLAPVVGTVEDERAFRYTRLILTLMQMQLLNMK